MTTTIKEEMRVILGKGRINLRETTTRVASQTARAKQHNERSYKSSKIQTRSIQPLQDVLDLQSSNENILHSISSCLPFGLTTSPRISSSGDKDSGLSNDLLIMASSKEQAQDHASIIVKLLVEPWVHSKRKQILSNSYIELRTGQPNSGNLT
ncbi:unnamed protein product [Rhizophagus irregularis]|nr:unnamed protein product [Rhizophagus irregularis]